MQARQQQPVPSLRNLVLAELTLNFANLPDKVFVRVAREYLPPVLREELCKTVQDCKCALLREALFGSLFYTPREDYIAWKNYCEKTARFRHVALDHLEKKKFNWPEKLLRGRELFDRVLSFENLSEGREAVQSPPLAEAVFRHADCNLT
jgi:hypothetical protein